MFIYSILKYNNCIKNFKYLIQISFTIILQYKKFALIEHKIKFIIKIYKIIISTVSSKKDNSLHTVYHITFEKTLSALFVSFYRHRSFD